MKKIFEVFKTIFFLIVYFIWQMRYAILIGVGYVALLTASIILTIYEDNIIYFAVFVNFTVSIPMLCSLRCLILNILLMKHGTKTNCLFTKIANGRGSSVCVEFINENGENEERKFSYALCFSHWKFGKKLLLYYNKKRSCLGMYSIIGDLIWTVIWESFAGIIIYITIII